MVGQNLDRWSSQLGERRGHATERRFNTPRWEIPMPVSETRFLIVLIALATGSLFLASCGSTMFPTPTPTPFIARSPTSGTQAAQLTELAAQGQQLFTRYRCTECHSLNGQRLVGPPLNGLYESKVPLRNGTVVTADDAYIKLSILEPDAQIVNGYQSGIMSGHIGQFQSDIAQDNNLDALVAFIKSQNQ
jgi:mono/diheme cytochrome c family protein